MAPNPLKNYFRKAVIYVKLPTLGKWYTPEQVTVTEDGEVAVYPLTALDDIMLNTPDAMLNGKALEKVISNCCPDVKQVKKLMLPDLEAIFVAIKCATNNGKVDYERACPECKYENTFELNCQAILDASTFINDDDLKIKFDDDLIIHVRPYDFEMRQLFTKREFEEERSLRAIDAENKNLDELAKADILGESVARLSQMTFALVSKSIEKIEMVKEQVTLSDHGDPEDRKNINEWLVSISKPQADIVIDAVNNLNNTGVPKTIPVTCSNCAIQWNDTLSFDPSSFFGKR